MYEAAARRLRCQRNTSARMGESGRRLEQHRRCCHQSTTGRETRTANHDRLPLLRHMGRSGQPDHTAGMDRSQLRRTPQSRQ